MKINVNLFAAPLACVLLAVPGLAQSGSMMHGKTMHGKMSQTAASRKVQAQVEKIKAGKNYNCCIKSGCNTCAVTMGMCPCGKHAAMGMPVCTQCKGGWEAGLGEVPGKTAADIKVMKMGGMSNKM